MDIFDPFYKCVDDILTPDDDVAAVARLWDEILDLVVTPDGDLAAHRPVSQQLAWSHMEIAGITLSSHRGKGVIRVSSE